ncbi:MAG TPA: type IVB secretion system protein IcmH/DotU [Pyrinomonadaceae bacterium]|nr:type IVB secretion system protein IcmH/DotU [Pyrinomonadaceae bacterium]
MQRVAEQPAAPARRRARPSSDLVSLAAPVLDMVLKLRAGVVAPSQELRPAISRLLNEVEQRGATLRYSDRQVKALKFALAAFVDETMMSTNFPLREEWEKFPLQLEYFGEHLAGVKFFDTLEEMLKNIESEADVVEVYYICMLLGFKGKYKVYMEDQLQSLIERTSAELRRVGRLQETELSPHWRVTDQPEPPPEGGVPWWLLLGGGAVFCLVVLIYLILFFVLGSDLKSAQEQLLR